MDLLDDFVSLLLITAYHCWVTARILFRRWRSRYWHEATATVVQFNIDTEEEQSEVGKNIETKHIKASYQYVVLGRTFTSNGVGVFDKLLVLNNYSDDLYRKLLMAYGTGEGFRIYFNPVDAAQAYITRRLYSPKFYWLCASGLTFLLLTIVSFHRIETIEFMFKSVLTLVLFCTLIVVEAVRK